MSDERTRQQHEVDRRRRMAAIFGDALPDLTRDECAEARGDVPPRGAGTAESTDPGEAWLRSQVPPHHG